ncbi:MAG: bifunctional DNA-binding transcriptional regulator/O6-methylguanine-DNA methyltransferase Ada [Sphingobium sp.]|nr:bifunctional DNA-binding transcriptional regulator/O6-methylguanine-DNA methyltransferase Ada [Sphingobium sp.]
MTDIRDQIDEATALAAFEARDKAMDGRFVIAVRTTRIYCKPSCPARRPKRENFEILANGLEAREKGYRPCLRCKPDEVGRDRDAIARAVAIIENSEAAPTLDALAAEVGYTPHHFQRIFARQVGVSPAAYARALRAHRLMQALDGEGRITDAIYDAGYEAPSRFYADAEARLGMSPSDWRKGGAGKTIRFAVVPSSLGKLLVAGTDKGLCRISFDEDEAALRVRFPQATILPADADFAALVKQVVDLVDDPARQADLPVDVAGTAFQQAVWQALRAIPAGETRTYSQIAAAVGRPAAVRATGSACGDNSLAILIPCHRVLRTDGSLGGYAYGLERKEKLLVREGAK